MWLALLVPLLEQWYIKTEALSFLYDMDIISINSWTGNTVSLLTFWGSENTLLSKKMDKDTGFSKLLSDIEASISKDDWEKAADDTGKAFNIWRDLKPSLQIDVDHDYVEMIEMMFVRLEVYISTHDRSEALASLRLILNTWENIGAI